MRRPLAAACALLAAGVLVGFTWFSLGGTEPVLPAVSSAPTSTGHDIPRSRPLEAAAIPTAPPEAQPSIPDVVEEPAQPGTESTSPPSIDKPLGWKDQIVERYSEPREPQHLVTLKGQVVDIAGRAVAGASVTVAGAVSSDKYMTKRGSLALATTGQDGDFQGSYTLPGTAVFELSLFASLDGLESERVLLAVRAGDTYEGILITLPEGGSVSGQVVGAGFEPIVQALISIATPLSERRERFAQGWPFGRADITGPDGRFTVANLQAGDYQLTVRAPGYTAAKVTVTVIAGVNTDLPAPIVLTAKTSVTVKLTCSQRQPNGKFTARFKLSDGSSVAKSASAAPDGHALIEDIPEDANEMTIEMPGFQPTPGIAIAPVKGAHADIGEIELLPAQSEQQD
jgi:hypothetical protein